MLRLDRASAAATRTRSGHRVPATPGPMCRRRPTHVGASPEEQGAEGWPTLPAITRMWVGSETIGDGGACKLCLPWSIDHNEHPEHKAMA